MHGCPPACLSVGPPAWRSVWLTFLPACLPWSSPLQASAHWAELEQEATSWQAQAQALEQQLQAAQSQVQQSGALAEVGGGGYVRVDMRACGVGSRVCSGHSSERWQVLREPPPCALLVWLSLPGSMCVCMCVCACVCACGVATINQCMKQASSHLAAASAAAACATCTPSPSRMYPCCTPVAAPGPITWLRCTINALGRSLLLPPQAPFVHHLPPAMTGCLSSFTPQAHVFASTHMCAIMSVCVCACLCMCLCVHVPARTCLCVPVHAFRLLLLPHAVAPPPFPALQTKEQRILELRAALASAMAGASDAAGVAAQQAAQQRVAQEAEDRATQLAQQALQQAQQAADAAVAEAQHKQAQAEVAAQQVRMRALKALCMRVCAWWGMEPT